MGAKTVDKSDLTRTEKKKEVEAVDREERLQQIRLDLIKKYNNSFNHWKDYYLLMTILAMFGLCLAYVDIEREYSNRQPILVSQHHDNDSTVLEYILAATTCMAIAACYIKEWFAQEWYDFRNPIIFHKAEIIQQIKEGFASEELGNANYQLHKRDLWLRVLLSPAFLIETLILLPQPYPMRANSGIPEHFEMETINWSGDHSCYQKYRMYTDDILFSLMFLRFYFLVQAIAAFAPTNKNLFGKRVCYEK